MKRIFLGIDPGITGAAAVLSEDNALILHDFINALETATFIKSLHSFEVIAAIEEVGAVSYAVVDMKTGVKQWKSQKGKNNFKFGENYGIWQGILNSNREFIKHIVYVTPQKWQKGLIPRKTNKNDKPGFFVAQKLFPNAPLKYKTKHHNRADALLIAYWLQNQFSA